MRGLLVGSLTESQCSCNVCEVGVTNVCLLRTRHFLLIFFQVASSVRTGPLASIAMALTLKVPFSPEEEAKMAVAAAGLSSLAGNSSMLASAQGGGGGDDAAHSGAQPQANAAPVSIGGAKTKLDELFLSWLALPDTGDLFAELLGQVREGRPLDAPAHTSLVTSLLNHHKPASHGTGSPSSPSPSSLRTRNSPPPRSPSRPGSPSKHFTFESGA